MAPGQVDEERWLGGQEGEAARSLAEALRANADQVRGGQGCRGLLVVDQLSPATAHCIASLARSSYTFW